MDDRQQEQELEQHVVLVFWQDMLLVADMQLGLDKVDLQVFEQDTAVARQFWPVLGRDTAVEHELRLDTVAGLEHVLQLDTVAEQEQVQDIVEREQVLEHLHIVAILSDII
jgi:hypothetical protein